MESLYLHDKSLGSKSESALPNSAVQLKSILHPQKTPVEHRQTLRKLLRVHKFLAGHTIFVQLCGLKVLKLRMFKAILKCIIYS